MVFQGFSRLFKKSLTLSLFILVHVQISPLLRPTRNLTPYPAQQNLTPYSAPKKLSFAPPCPAPGNRILLRTSQQKHSVVPLAVPFIIGVRDLLGLNILPKPFSFSSCVGPLDNSHPFSTILGIYITKAFTLELHCLCSHLLSYTQ